MSDRPPILVDADWRGLSARPRRMGILHRVLVRGEEVLSFEYARDWLELGEPFVLDPKLQYFGGRQYADSPAGFGLFSDSAPDRWGRLLIQRRASLEGKGASGLYETDYLLAVSDRCRMGGLRFRLSEDGPYLAEANDYPVPPLESLRQLEQASRYFEEADVGDPNYREWLRLLLAPGTSLGGARPKASVMDPDGQLWVAKFPSRSDTYDVSAWEGLVYELAREAGLRVGVARTEAFSQAGATFLIRRFDRAGAERIHFASAMNLLGYQDGDGAKTGASYLDLVDWIERNGADVEADLEELWRRIVFNICVHNTDDHLRNHGFLLGAQGWHLSPVYDVNPQPWPGGLALNVDDASNACDLDLARSVGRYFRLSNKRQDQILSEVRSSLAQWRECAFSLGISRSEVEQMKIAFEGNL